MTPYDVHHSVLMVTKKIGYAASASSRAAVLQRMRSQRKHVVGFRLVLETETDAPSLNGQGRSFPCLNILNPNLKAESHMLRQVSPLPWVADGFLAQGSAACGGSPPHATGEVSLRLKDFHVLTWGSSELGAVYFGILSVGKASLQGPYRSWFWKVPQLCFMLASQCTLLLAYRSSANDVSCMATGEAETFSFSVHGKVFPRSDFHAAGGGHPLHESRRRSC